MRADPAVGSTARGGGDLVESMVHLTAGNEGTRVHLAVERPVQSGAGTLRVATATRDATVDAAGVLYRRWHPSHGIDVNDAILVATAAATGGRIHTQDLKHYPMPDVVVVKGW